MACPLKSAAPRPISVLREFLDGSASGGLVLMARAQRQRRQAGCLTQPELTPDETQLERGSEVGAQTLAHLTGAGPHDRRTRSKVRTLIRSHTKRSSASRPSAHNTST